MTRASLLHLLDHVNGISDAEIRELEQLAATFPYCQTAHVLLAKAAHDRGSMLAGQRLRRAATYAADRELLRHLLEQPAALPAPASVAVAEEAAPAETTQGTDEPLASEADLFAVAAPELSGNSFSEETTEQPASEAEIAGVHLEEQVVTETPAVEFSTTAEAEETDGEEVNDTDAAQPETTDVAAGASEPEAATELEASEPPEAAVTPALEDTPASEETAAPKSVPPPVAEPAVPESAAAPEPTVATEEMAAEAAPVAAAETDEAATTAEPADDIVSPAAPETVEPVPAAEPTATITELETEAAETSEPAAAYDLLPAVAPPIRPPVEAGISRFEFGLGGSRLPEPSGYQLPDADDAADDEESAELPTLSSVAASAVTAPFRADADLGYALGAGSRLGYDLQPHDGFTLDLPLDSFFEPDALLLAHARAHQYKPKTSSLDLINRFLKVQPRIKTPGGVPLPASEQADLSVRSTSAAPALASESLAKIMIRQGKPEKAIEIYERLMARQPEKKAYFAEQIQQLQQPLK